MKEGVPNVDPASASAATQGPDSPALPSSMVERMANAMRLTSAGQPFSWANAARAALEVLRSPTDEMIRAGRNAFPGICGVMHEGDKPAVPIGLYDEERTLARTKAVFRRMLNAAEGVELYRPPNGFGGMYFMERWCDRCTKDNLDDDTGEGGCEIIAYTMACDEDDDDYPRAWRYGPDGHPLCTEFERREHADASGADGQGPIAAETADDGGGK